MRGLSEREKRILSLRQKRLSAYKIGRELGIHPPHVYRSIKTGQKKLRKFLQDLRELGIQSAEIERFLRELQEEPRQEEEDAVRLILE